MDLDGLVPQIRHFPATIKSTGQTQLDVLRDMIVQIFPLSSDLSRGFYTLKPKLVSVTN